MLLFLFATSNRQIIKNKRLKAIIIKTEVKTINSRRVFNY